MSEAEFTWQGVNPAGNAVGGRMTIDPAHLAAIVEDRFKSGWRHLNVVRDGIEVGYIGMDREKSPERTWWAEGSVLQR